MYIGYLPMFKVNNQINNKSQTYLAHITEKAMLIKFDANQLDFIIIYHDETKSFRSIVEIIIQ